MLALRLARGSRPLVQLRRLLVAAASACSGFLLLYVLAGAVDRPAGSFPRLLWALVPLAATVHFAVSVARTDPATRPRAGLDAAGLGPVRLVLAAAISTAVACTLGSALALAAFLHLRGDLAGLPFDGAGAALLHADQPLPVAAALTLLALIPLTSSVATALALRPHAPLAPQTGLPWGIALTACGLAAEAYGGRSASGMLVGWSLTAIGLALAGPGLAYACGWLIQAVRPGALRLLAGRALQEEATRLGPPLGVLCAVGAAALTLLALPDRGGPHAPLGPLTGPAAALVVLCAAATLLTSAVEARQARGAGREALVDLGAPAKVLRTAASLRATALVALCVPLSWGVAQLTSLALTR
uniref:Integral membrane protein n=1 Tax=Streptomyces sp. NBC_00049 TaxID=2903617 RepID=A0AAU2JWM6_9ACTN